jgi:hypothetical protein
MGVASDAVTRMSECILAVPNAKSAASVRSTAPQRALEAAMCVPKDPAIGIAVAMFAPKPVRCAAMRAPSARQSLLNVLSDTRGICAKDPVVFEKTTQRGAGDQRIDNERHRIFGSRDGNRGWAWHESQRTCRRGILRELFRSDPSK